MKQGVFSNGNAHRGDTREILIVIEDEFIAFYFYEQYLRQRAWIDEEMERRELVNEPELTEDEKSNHEFYWIPKEDWVRDLTERQDREDNWHYHMSHKSWFTTEMEDFINLNSKL